MLTATLADLLTPLYSGRLVDAVAGRAAVEAMAWDAALAAFSMLIALALGALVMRQVAFACGLILYVALPITLPLGYVAPAAGLANS